MRATALSVLFNRCLLTAVAGVGLSAEVLPAQRAPGNGDLYDSSFYSAMRYRSIGPFRGGRSTAVTGVADQPHTFYMGSTGGGVWKTDDAGVRWRNISDGFFEVASIGAIDVADSDANVIYVGTGSAGIRGNVSTGRGVYKSTDGGKTWSFAGLPEAGLIGRIAVHPTNPDVVYLAALGHPFGKNDERGVFRSQDGGGNWEKVLFLSDSTGAVDLSMNPSNPREIYAAMWRAERKPWTLIDGAEEGGVYKTTDGGDSWTELAGGLPQGLTGRIGVAVSPANPERVWALVNAHDPEGGVYRSDDAGATWQRVNRNRNLRQRAWYYSHLTAHPTNENTVYSKNTSLYVSVDGGANFESISVPHGDVHALWVNPANPALMVVGNDGGAQVSLNGGGSWSTPLNQPTAEFYRVTVDNRFPYRVYGAQQDNSTISVPSGAAGAATPQQETYSVGGCESGHIALHPQNPDLIYAGCYIGEITRYDRRTGDSRNVMIYPVLVDGIAPRDLAYRFQWNAPIVPSVHDPDVVYHTSQHVHRTRDGGLTWETISPDLTTDNEAQQDLPGGPLQHDHTSVEVYNTIFSLVESPHTRGTLWTGSDDGLVHISRDDGGSWADITPGDMPSDATVNTIEVSSHQPGRAFLAVHRYRMDDYSPYVFRTDDYGDSWTLLTDGTNGIPANYPVRVVREDPDRRGLLYAGTEFGMFVSFDDGARWQSLQLNLPMTPITDLSVHRQDLVVATQGRSFWILDDLTPLHQVADAAASEAAFLYQPRDPYRVRGGGFRGGSGGQRGAVLHYYFGEAPDGEVTLEILDATSEVVRTFSSDSVGSGVSASAGMNRFVWNLTYPGVDVPRGAIVYLGYSGGPTAVPGAYQMRLSTEEWSQTRRFEIKIDPRLERVTNEELLEQFRLGIRIRDRMDELYDGVRQLRSVREQAIDVGERAEANGMGNSLSEAAATMTEKLTAVEDSLLNKNSESRQDPINFPPLLDNQFGYLYRYVNGAYGVPTRAAYERMEELENSLVALLAQLQLIINDDVERFNDLARAQGVGGVITRRQPPIP